MPALPATTHDNGAGQRRTATDEARATATEGARLRGGVGEAGGRKIGDSHSRCAAPVPGMERGGERGGGVHGGDANAGDLMTVPIFRRQSAHGRRTGDGGHDGHAG